MKRKAYFLSLFAGIAGFDLGAYRAGLRFDGHYFSEVDAYASAVFQKRFPDAVPLGDVRSIDYGKLPKGDWLVTGGPPCQPFSCAGRRLQEKDGRNMWPEAVRAVRELKPRTAVFENVIGVLDYLDREILPAIEGEGYGTGTVCIPASAVGARHERKRWWVIADSKGFRRREVGKGRERSRKNRFKKPAEWQLLQSYVTGTYTIQHWEDDEHILTGNIDGVPYRMDRLKCAGNAVVPQVCEMIFNLPVFDRWRAA